MPPGRSSFWRPNSPATAWALTQLLDRPALEAHGYLDCQNVLDGLGALKELKKRWPALPGGPRRRVAPVPAATAPDDADVLTTQVAGATVARMPQPPALTAEQRQAALDKAAKVRRDRAEVKEKLKMGTMSLLDLLARAESDETIGKMKVLSVLESLPGLGKVKARRLMESVGISETRRLQGLGANQREALLQQTQKS